MTEKRPDRGHSPVWLWSFFSHVTGLSNTNFLGICWEHTENTSTEFINEDDMEELFQNLDDGKVHYAGEVRVSVQIASAELISIYGYSIIGNSWRPWYSL